MTEKMKTLFTTAGGVFLTRYMTAPQSLLFVRK